METTHLKAPLAHLAPISMTTITVLVIIGIVLAIGIAISSARKAVPALSQPDAAYISAPAPSVGNVPQAEISTKEVEQYQPGSASLNRCADAFNEKMLYVEKGRSVPSQLQDTLSRCEVLAKRAHERAKRSFNPLGAMG